jgi:hypothetical protein
MSLLTFWVSKGRKAPDTDNTPYSLSQTFQTQGSCHHGVGQPGLRTEDNCEYTEQAVADSRQGVFL